MAVDHNNPTFELMHCDACGIDWWHIVNADTIVCPYCSTVIRLKIRAR